MIKEEGMETIVLTVEELREMIRNLPEEVLLRVTVQEAGDGSDKIEEV